jgi:hypothetical protein
MHLNVIELARIPLRGATQPLGLRWGFETTSRQIKAESAKSTGSSQLNCISIYSFNLQLLTLF